MPLEKLWILQPTLEHHCKDCNSPHTQAHIVKQISIHASWKWQDGRTPSSEWTGLCKLSFYLPVMFFKRVVLQLHSVHPLDMSTIIVFCVFGIAVQMKSAYLKQLSSYQLYTLGVACWEVTWPNDIQTRLCQYIGIPLDRLHWKHNGWCYHPVVSQWQSNVNLHNWNTLGDHWSHKYTGMPLEPHWLMLAPNSVPVAMQC